MEIFNYLTGLRELYFAGNVKCAIKFQMHSYDFWVKVAKMFTARVYVENVISDTKVWMAIEKYYH